MYCQTQYSHTVRILKCAFVPINPLAINRRTCSGETPELHHALTNANRISRLPAMKPALSRVAAIFFIGMLLPDFRLSEISCCFNSTGQSFITLICFAGYFTIRSPSLLVEIFKIPNYKDF